MSVESPVASRQRLAERVRAVPPSGIRKFFDVIATMPDVISLGVGEPDFTTPPQIVEEGVRSLRAGRTHYTSNFGTLDLRRALSTHLDRMYGLHYEPSYVAYLPAILFNGGKPVFVPTSAERQFALDPDAVEAAVTPRTKVLFLGYPCNPTGAVLDADTLSALADIANRHDLLVVSDEIYDRLVYGDHRHTPIAALSGMRDRTITIGGFSKAYAMTGWRVGYACAPKDLLEGLVKVHQYQIMSAPTTAQDAAVVAINTAEQDVRRMVDEYDHRRRMFVEGLNRIGLPTFEPRGAFYAFPNIRGTGLSSEEFSERLLFEAQVAVIPGSAFGPSGEGFVRACYATSYEGLEEALTRMGRFVDKLGR